jgi:hypothetical protein
MNLDYIKAEVDKLAAIIDAPFDKAPNYGCYVSEHETYIQVDEDGYMCYLEKSFDDDGNEDVYKMKTKELDELLYWIFDRITRSMGWDYAEKNRDPNQSFVEQRLKKQEELIGLIKEEWRQRCILENEDVRKRGAP